jgi:hypothetical protein
MGTLTSAIMGNYYGRGIILTLTALVFSFMTLNEFFESQRYAKPPTVIMAGNLMKSGVPDYDYVTVTGFADSNFLPYQETTERRRTTETRYGMYYPLFEVRGSTEVMLSQLGSRPQVQLLVHKELDSLDCVKPTTCSQLGAVQITGKVSKYPSGGNISEILTEFNSAYDVQRSSLMYLDASWRPASGNVIGLSLMFATVFGLIAGVSWMMPFLTSRNQSSENLNDILRPQTSSPAMQPAMQPATISRDSRQPAPANPNAELGQRLDPVEEQAFAARHGKKLGRG